MTILYQKFSLYLVKLVVLFDCFLLVAWFEFIESGKRGVISQSLILGANKEAVFYKVFKKDGEVKISEQIANSGFTTNSIISSPLFDLDTVASRDLNVKDINDDDYIYSKIHKIIAEKIKNNNMFDDKEISKMIEEELDKI